MRPWRRSPGTPNTGSRRPKNKVPSQGHCSFQTPKFPSLKSSLQKPFCGSSKPSEICIPISLSLPLSLPPYRHHASSTTPKWYFQYLQCIHQSCHFGTRNSQPSLQPNANTLVLGWRSIQRYQIQTTIPRCPQSASLKPSIPSL